MSGDEPLEAQALRELLGDPPAGLQFVERLDDWLPDRHKRPLRRSDEEGRVVPFEVCRLGQDHVGIIDLIDGQDIHHHHQVQLLDRFKRAFRLRDAR